MVVLKLLFFMSHQLLNSETSFLPTLVPSPSNQRLVGVSKKVSFLIITFKRYGHAIAIFIIYVFNFFLGWKTF